MKFAAFQRALHATDPRGVVLLTSPLVDVLPYIAVQCEEFSRELRVYAHGRLVHLAGNLDPDVAAKVHAEGLFDDSSQCEHLLPVFTRCFDEGLWLVVPDPTEVDMATWRDIAKVLVTSVPDERTYLSRRHFRLFTFVSPGVSLPDVLPPLICQYAFVVDNDGAVKTRAQLGPLFDGTTTMEGYRALAEFSKSASEGSQSNTNSYVQLLLASMKTQSLPEDELRTPATDVMYVNEVLFKLREALLEQQALLIGEAQRLDEEADEAFEAVVARQRDRLGDDYDEQKDRDRHAARTTAEKELARNYAWIYQRALEWIVAQSPDVDLTGIPMIPESDVAAGDTVWVRDDEECHEALWSGCPVCTKKPLLSLVDAPAAERKKAFAAEAARHASLRHPNVVAFLGSTAHASGSIDTIVMEKVRGTLEQALVAARFEGTRWTVAQFLDLAIDVLRGLTYLSTVVVHRDVSIRSVLQCHGAFKIGQFTITLPLSFDDTSAMRGVVPLRWTAPEGFAGAFSPASDMWSFGMLMWMAVQYATAVPYDRDPYPPTPIVQGVIPEKPRSCPDVIYDDIIARCLQRDPGARPTASRALLRVQTVRQSLPVGALRAEVPFPSDECSFSSWLERCGRGSR